MPKPHPNQIDKKIGVLIRDARTERQLTLKELAGKLGLQHNAVAKYERGITPITVSRLIAIAQILDVGLLDLIPQI